MSVQLNTYQQIILTQPILQDSHDFLDLVKRSRDFHASWVAPPSDENEYQKYLDRISTDNQCGLFLRLKSTHQIIAVFNISEIVRGCFQSAYLGFYVFHGYQKQGLMTLGLQEVLQYAFTKLNLHRLEANIQPSNLPSIALVKKCGFKREGFSERYLFIDGVWKDHERFAITKESFLSK
jgi:ribosomal-protein-alanine N-acetyltransferase